MKINYESFNYSLSNHQKLVDIIECHISKGERTIPKTKLAKEMDKSYTWVCKAMKRLNVEEECITYEKNGMKINYSDLKINGVFSRILEMMKVTEQLNILVRLNNKQLCEIFKVKETTVQMYRSYILDENDNYATTFRTDKILEQALRVAPESLENNLETIIKNALNVMKTAPGNEQKN